MRIQYTIPEISALALLSEIEVQNENDRISYDAEDPSRAYRVKWTKQDDCPMFYQALLLISEDIREVRYKEDILSQIFVYIDFSGIFDRTPTGRIAELQRKAQSLFRPEGVEINLNQRFHQYIAFERSASMSRNSKLCFVRAELYEPLKERMMLGMTIGSCQLSKLYAYNGLMFTGGQRLERPNLLNERRIIVIDNPKYIIPNVETITVEDDGTDHAVRGYSRVEKTMDIEITEFDGEGLVSPRLARGLDPLSYKAHRHHSFQIRMPYIKGVVHEVDFASLFQELEVHMIQDIWGNWHSADDVDLILTKSMFKGFGWMTENGLTWAEYLRRCWEYGHALYVSGMDALEPQEMTELNYQFLNTAAITDEEFRPADIPAEWYMIGRVQDRQWLTKATEEAYFEFTENLSAQRDYYLSKLDDPELDITDRRRYRAQLIGKNLWFLFEPIYQKELRDKAEHILNKFRNANLLAAGDNRYLSDDLMRLLAVIVQPVSAYAYRVLMSESMAGAVFYAPKPAYPPNEMYTLLRNPHIARNEEVIARPFVPGKLREKYMGHLHYVVMVDSRSLIPERLGGADYDGDMIKTISDPLMNRCVARNYGDNFENEGNLPLLKIPSAKPILADAQDWKARFETVKATFSSRIGQISNAALRRSIIAYDENSTAEEREQCRRETETLAILTGLEIDSAKSGIKPDLSQYLDGNRGKKSLFLRYKTIAQKGDARRWYEPTQKQRLDSFFDSVDWDSVSSNLEKLPYYAKRLKETNVLTMPAFTDKDLFTFAADPKWKEKLDPVLLKRVAQVVSDYEEAQRRCRLLRIEPKHMTRKNDVQRILYARNQEDRCTVEELYHSFDSMSPEKIRTIRHMLTEGNWMYARPEERWDYLDDLPMLSVRFWDLFMDFRCGGYRILPDIICDFDDMYSQYERNRRMLCKKGDSKDLKRLMANMDQEEDRSNALVRRCAAIFSPVDGRKQIRSDDVVKCAVALGKRHFALEVYPAAVLDLAVDRNPEERRKRRKWRWPWDAERD